MQKKTINKLHFLIGLILLLGVIIPTIFSITSVNLKKVFAEDYTLTYTYSSSTQTYTITGYTGTPIDITFPATYNDGPNGEKPVTSIKSSAFQNCLSLNSVMFSNSIINIANNAFYGCSNLISITIPNVITIGDAAFNNCSSLTEITLPNSVTSIGNWAFSHCTNLNSITIPDSVTSIGSLAFSETAWFNSQPDGVVYAGKIAYKYKGSMPGNTSVILSNDTVGISGDSFSNCTDLTSISIPNDVIYIGSGAFRNCSNLTLVNFENNNVLKSIEEKAFKNCSSLTSINIPSSVTTIEQGTFFGCTSLESMRIPFVGNKLNGTTNTSFLYIFSDIIGDNSNAVPKSLKTVIITGGTSIPKDAFKGHSSITSITLPDNLSDIGESAFENCISLTSIIIPNSSTNIGPYAFKGSGLTSITIPYGFTTIGVSSFSGCSNLTSVELPDSLTSIGRGAFSSCSSLTEIIIPNSVTSIENSAFRYCSSLKSITFKEDSQLTSIGNSAFNSCLSLVSIDLPNSVTNIGSFAFQDCSSLLSIIIPNGVTTIEQECFSGCSSLMSVEIPNGVTKIRISAFEDCSSLTEIIIPNSVTSIEPSSFYGCTSLFSITVPFVGTSISSGKFTDLFKENPSGGYTDVPESLKTVIITGGSIIPEFAFSGCKNVTSITIPNGVTSIAEYAFLDCSSLIRIEIPASVTSIAGFGVNRGSAFNGCSSLTSIQVDPNSIFYSSDERGVLFDKNKTKLICYPAGNTETAYYIPNSVTNIGNYAFNNCTNLTSIYIANSVTNTGIEAFVGCLSLTSFQVDPNNNYYSSDERGVLFDEIKTKLICYPAGNTETAYSIPNSVTSIGGSAFMNCSNLTSITIPNSVTSIGDSAFQGCSSLSSITFAEGSKLTSIGDSAFRDCSSLTEITIPSSVTSIGDWAFDACYKLVQITNLTAPSLTLSGLPSNPGQEIRTSTETPFINTLSDFDGNGVQTFTIGSTKYLININKNSTNLDLSSYTDISAIYQRCFYNNENLTSIIFPNTITTINVLAFYGCTNLTSINLRSEIPASISTSFGINLENTNAKIYVPAVSLSAYKSSPVWSIYASIIFAEVGQPTPVKIDPSNTEVFGSEEIEITVGNEFEDLENFREDNINIKDGYTFTGWEYNDALVTESTEFNYEEKVVIVPIFDPNTYTVTFKLYEEDVEYVGEVSLTYESLINYLPDDPEREGYTFIGWYFGDIKIEIGGTYMIANDTTVIAKWILKLNISYLDYEDLEVLPLEMIDYGSDLIQPDDPEREGYTFGGWYISKEYSEPFVFGNEITQDTNIYAKFTKIVKIKIEDSEIEEPLTVGKEFEDLENLRQDNVDSKTGYTLVGWIYNNETVTQDTVFNYDDDIIITAVYDPNTYTVTFNIEYEEGPDPTPIELTYDDLIEILPTPTRDGYMFKGWYIGDRKIEQGRIYDIANDSVLTALWEEAPKNYTWIYIVSSIAFVALSSFIVLLIKYIKKKKFKKV